MRRTACVLCLLLGGCLLPVPGPGPTPPTPNPPNVVAASLQIVTVTDKALPGPEDALVSDLAYWNTVSARGHKWMHLDTSNQWAVTNRTAITNAGGPPCELLFNDQTDKLIVGIRLPPDKASQDAIIKQYSGK